MKILCQAMDKISGKRSDTFILSGDFGEVILKCFPDGIDNLLILPLLHIAEDGSDPVISTLPIVPASFFVNSEVAK